MADSTVVPEMQTSSEGVGVTETVTSATAVANDNHHKETMKGRKVSWAKLRRVDSLNLEAGRVSFAPSHANNSKVYLPSISSILFIY